MYMVSVLGAGAPKKEHLTLEEAKTEAERLGRMPENFDRKIYVLQCICYLEPITRHVWKNGDGRDE